MTLKTTFLAIGLILMGVSIYYFFFIIKWLDPLLLLGVLIFFILFIIGLYCNYKNKTIKARWFEYGFFVSLFIASVCLTNQGVLLALNKDNEFLKYSYIVFYGIALGCGYLHYIFQIDGKCDCKIIKDVIFCAKCGKKIK